jgi:predicted transcriptional regulator
MTITTSSKASAATRDKTELITSILKAANGRDVNAAQIMYSAFLSYAQIKQEYTIHYRNEQQMNYLIDMVITSQHPLTH